jgi:hypothetical protein
VSNSTVPGVVVASWVISVTSPLHVTSKGADSHDSLVLDESPTSSGNDVDVHASCVGSALSERLEIDP